MGMAGMVSECTGRRSFFLCVLDLGELGGLGELGDLEELGDSVRSLVSGSGGAVATEVATEGVLQAPLSLRLA